KTDRGRGGSVQRFDATGHGNTNPRIGTALDFFGKPSTFVADEESHWLAPIDFPGSEQRLLTVARFVDAGNKRANACNLELREENRKRHARENREMQGSARGGAQRFRRKWVCGAADAGSGGSGACRAKGGSGAQDGSHVSGILDACQNDEQGSASGKRSTHEIVKRGLPRMNQRGDALRMFGVSETFEEAVRC